MADEWHVIFSRMSNHEKLLHILDHADVDLMVYEELVEYLIEADVLMVATKKQLHTRAEHG